LIIVLTAVLKSMFTCPNTTLVVDVLGMLKDANFGAPLLPPFVPED